jgi:(4S)-4-hydroxy-5-phosphonooxypentane-2,3-dione isomerase
MTSKVKRETPRRRFLTCQVMGESQSAAKSSMRANIFADNGANTMAVTYVINFRVQQGQREEFLKLLEALLDAMRGEPLFREAILHRDPASEDRFMFYETWESHEDVLNVQLHRPYRQAWHEALPHLLAQARDIAIWEPMRSDRKSL